MAALHSLAYTPSRMRVLVTGSRGLIGSALVPALESAGHSVTRLVRGKAGKKEISWDPSGRLDSSATAGFDAVVHLAGESIAGRWTDSKKERISNSRIQGTHTLVNALMVAPNRPRVTVSASAVGYYGDRGDELLTEQSAPGSDFLADVCQRWEQAVEEAGSAGIRTVELRIGLVLSKHGGGLAQMLPPFRMGLGGRMGSGKQYWPWVSIADVVGAMMHALETDSMRGAYNVVAPQAVTNAEFTRTLGGVLHRPTIFPMPAFVVRAAFGQMGTALLLASQRVSSKKLEASGYKFKQPELKGALEELLR